MGAFEPDRKAGNAAEPPYVIERFEPFLGRNVPEVSWRFRGKTDGEGRLEMVQVPPGPARVTVRRDEEEPEILLSQDVTVAPKETVGVTLTVP